MSKTILITGTSSGFGKDTALTLKAAGHRVFGTLRGINGKSAAVAQELQSKGIELIELDVTDGASVDAAFKAFFEKTDGKLDVLINNAGIMVQGLSEAITIEQATQMFNVNVLGIQRTLRAALPNMRKASSGLVINVGSILGRVTIPFLGLYGASKFAVEAMTESYRYELSQLGIDVVLVQPSAYPTNLYDSHGNLTAGDVAREPEYGEIAEIPKAFNAFIGDMFASNEAPNPHDVAAAIADLIKTPAGQRAARVVVGNPFGADAVNTAVEPIQAGLINGLGMDGIAKLKVA